MTRTCKRCAVGFERGKRSRDVFCSKCEEETADLELAALIFSDRTGIYNLYEDAAEARRVMRNDTMYAGASRLSLVQVVGQKGAREALRVADDPNQDYWDRLEQAQANSDFERSV